MLNINMSFMFKNKRYGFLVILILVTIIASMIYKAPHFKALSINKDGVRIEYYDIAQRVELSVKKPVIAISPDSFRLSYPNPASPSSLHGTFTINIENNGDENALIPEISWKIIDGDRTITPPEEWRKIIGEPQLQKFYLPAHTGMRYIYGPEIGAAGKNKILLGVSVKYANPIEKNRPLYVSAYSGTISYDKNVKTNYSGSDFVKLTSSNEFGI